MIKNIIPVGPTSTSDYRHPLSRHEERPQPTLAKIKKSKGFPPKLSGEEFLLRDSLREAEVEPKPAAGPIQTASSVKPRRFEQ